MGRRVNHKQIYREGVFGGMVNTTLCGRRASCDNDAHNVGDSDADVTCKFCLRIMATARRIAKAKGD